jgi:flagellar motor switch protein FliM
LKILGTEMTNKDAGLTDEELSAIASSMSDSAHNVINAAGDSLVVSHDLAREDSALGFNQSAVDLVNERFARQVRTGLIEVLRTTPKITTSKVEIQTFRESTRTLAAPLAISTIRMDPLRGVSLVVIDPKIIFSTLDSFFGGFGRGIDQLTATRIFTPTEDTIISLLMNIILASLKEAWSPILHVDFQRVSQEVNPAFAQIADDSDPMLVSRFNFALGDNEEGFIHIIQPFSLLKPIRDLLRSRIVTTDDENDQTKKWTKDLLDACKDVPLEMKVRISEFDLTYGDLESLTLNQVIPVELFDFAEVDISGSSAFLGVVGELDGKAAVELKTTKTVNYE